MIFSSKSQRISWHTGCDTLVWLSVFALAMAAACFQILNSDIFWHLTTGRLMAQGGSGRGILPPLHDTFSFTGPPQGREWIDLHWLFQWFAYGLWSIGGLNALIWAKLFLVSTWMGILFWVFRKRLSSGVAGFCIALALLASHPRLMVRPELLSFTYAIALGLLLETFFKKPTRLLFAGIILMQGLWVNSQGIFIIGLLLIGSYTGWQLLLPKLPHKRLAAALGLSALLICLLNPYGLKGLLFPLTLYSRIDAKALNIYSSQIGEFFPTLDRVAAIEPSYLFYFKAYALLLFSSLVLGLTMRMWQPQRWCVALGLFYLALRANRNVALFCLATLPLLLSFYADFQHRRPLPKFLHVALSGFALLFCLVQIPGLTTNRSAIHDLSIRRSGFGLRESEYPVAAVDLLRRYHLSGNFFAEYQHFGYLLWNVPGARISFDGRLEVYFEDDFRQYLFFLTGGWADRSSDPELAFGCFQEALSTLNTPQPLTGILLNIEAQTLPLTFQNMQRLSRDWALVSLNLNSALFLNRRLTENQKAISENEIAVSAPASGLHLPPPIVADHLKRDHFFKISLSNRLFFSVFPKPEPYPEDTLRLGQFLLNLGVRDAARSYLEAPLQAGLHYADSYLAKSIFDETLAEKIDTLDQGIKFFGDNPQLYYRKGKLLERAQSPQTELALRTYDAALQQDRRFFPALIAKSHLLGVLQRNEERYELLQQAFSDRVKHPDLLFALNEELVRRKEHHKALKVLKEANLIFHGDDPEVWFRMAFSQHALNQKQQARFSLLRAKGANQTFFSGKTQSLRPTLSVKIAALEKQL